MDDRSTYQQWVDGVSGTPDEEQETQLSINQETAAPEGTNVIDTSRLSVEDIEGPTPQPPQPAQPTQPAPEAAPEEPEQSYGEKATANESVVDKWIGDGLAFVKDAFDDRDYDEIRQEMNENNVKRENAKSTFEKTTDELVKVGSAGITTVANSAAQIGKLALDTAGSALGFRDDAPAPWTSEYEGAEFNLIGAKPVSQVGELGAVVLGFMQNASAINKAIPSAPSIAQAPGVVGKVQRAHRGLTVGAIADLVYTPGDGNSINMLQDAEFLGIGKLMKETGFLDAIAHKDDDNEFTRRIKNGIEGGIMEKAVDGVGLAITGTRRVIKDIFKPAMDAYKVPARELPPQVTEAGEIIFQQISRLDDPQLLRQTSEVMKDLEELKLKVKGDQVAEQAIENAKIINKQLELDMSTAPRQTEMGDLLGDPQFKGKPIYTRRPGFDQRKAEDVANSGTKEQQIYEPNERSGKSASFPVREVAAQQAVQPEAGSALPRPSTNPLTTDAMKKQLNASSDGMGDLTFKMFEQELALYHGTKNADAIRKGGFNVGGDDLNSMGEGVYFTTNSSLADEYGEGVLKGSANNLKLLDLVEQKKAVADFLRENGLGDLTEINPKSAAMAAKFGGTPKPNALSLEQKGALRQWAKNNGYDGIRYTADFNTAPTKGRMDEVVIFDPKKADGVIKNTTFNQEMDAFRASNKKTTPEAQAKVRDLVTAWKNKDASAMELLHQVVDDGGLPMPVIRTIYGDLAGRAIINDLGNQIAEKVPLMQEIMSKGGDITRQADMIIDDLIAVGKETIKGRSYKGSAMAALRADAPIDDLIRKVDEGAFDAPTRKDPKVEKKLENFQSEWEAVRAGIKAGDPKALETMEVLGDGLVLADGNADLIETFSEQILRLGAQNFRTTMYNAYLSSLRTHERNILGTGFNVAAKPLLAAGGSLAKPAQARAALSMYGSIFGGLGDSYKAARIQWQKTGDAQVARGHLMSQKSMAEQVDNAYARAKTPGQAAAAMFVRAQYYLLATPAGQYATRAMNSTDAAFRVISARQSAKFDYMTDIAKEGKVYSGDDLNAMIKSKFDKDFSIVDPVALHRSKEDTFQQDLNVFMGKLDDTIKAGGPLTSAVLPFIKTPTNILSQTPQFMPILPRIAKHTDLGGAFMKEYHAVVNGDDELLKAVYKGREGAAYIVGITATNMALNGILTGSGHVDYGERQLDELKTPRHSIKIGGKWHSHRFLGPISTVLSMYADAGYVMNNSHRYDDYNEYFGQAAYSIAGAMFEQSWLKGLVDSIGYLEEITNGRRAAKISEAPDVILANTLRAFTKYGGALKDFNNLLVPGAREYNSNMERYRAETIPFAKAFSGAEKISPISGEPIMDHAQARTNVLTPFSSKDVNESEAVEGLVKYGIDYTLELNDHYNGITLSATTKHEVNKIMAKPGGQMMGLEDMLVNHFASPGFQKQYNEWLETPTPKEEMQWYKDTVKKIADLRSYAVNKYKNSGSDDARQLSDKLNKDKEYKAQAAAGRAKSARRAFDELNELNKP